MTDPDNKTTGYTYNTMGKLLVTTKPNADTSTNAWDTAGELTGITYSGSSTPAVTYTYDSSGRRTSMTDGSGTTTYQHDVFGETTAVTTGSGATTTYGYDAAGNTTNIGYPTTGTSITRAFNAIEQLASITDPTSGITSFTYTKDGALTKTTYPNGTTNTIGYDNADQPTSSALAKGTTALGTITYARDNTGDLTGTTPGSGAPGSATTYGYSSNQYLTGSTVSGTTMGYAYDTVGNPTSLGANKTQAFDAAGRLCWTSTSTVGSPTCGSPATGGTTYAYDANGNRTGKTPTGGPATTYAYNAAGELTGVSGATTASYTYNGDGLRVTKTTGGATATFTWDSRGSVPTVLSDGSTDYVYGPAGVPVEQFTAGGANTAFFFTDAHGSTVDLTNSSGTITGSYAYTAWGTVASHTGASTPIEYAAAYSDSETGFLYLQARYYDPETGVFASVDALVSKTLAAYLYANNDPLNMLDPLGLWGWGDTWRLVGAIGVGVGVIALAATGVGLIADAGLLTVAIGFEAAETVGAVATTVALGAGTLGVGLDGASCAFGGDSEACSAMMMNGVGVGEGYVGAKIGSNGLPYSKQLGVGLGVAGLVPSGIGFGLDIHSFIKACSESEK